MCCSGKSVGDLTLDSTCVFATSIYVAMGLSLLCKMRSWNR